MAHIFMLPFPPSRPSINLTFFLDLPGYSSFPATSTQLDVCLFSVLFMSKSDSQRLEAGVSFSEFCALQNAICTYHTL